MDRISGLFFMPDHATIEDLRSCLFWCDEYEIDGQEERGDISGIMLKYQVKPEDMGSFFEFVERFGGEIIEPQDSGDEQ